MGFLPPLILTYSPITYPWFFPTINQTTILSDWLLWKLKDFSVYYPYYYQEKNNIECMLRRVTIQCIVNFTWPFNSCIDWTDVLFLIYFAQSELNTISGFPKQITVGISSPTTIVDFQSQRAYEYILNILELESKHVDYGWTMNISVIFSSLYPIYKWVHGYILSL